MCCILWYVYVCAHAHMHACVCACPNPPTLFHRCQYCMFNLQLLCRTKFLYVRYKCHALEVTFYVEYIEYNYEHLSGNSVALQSLQFAWHTCDVRVRRTHGDFHSHVPYMLFTAWCLDTVITLHLTFYTRSNVIEYVPVSELIIINVFIQWLY